MRIGIVDADLLINGEKSLSVKMRYAYAEIPILALFKCLGANIQWDNDTITVKYNEQIIKLYPSKGRIELENGKQYGQVPPGGLAIFIVRDKEVYIDTGMAADLLKNFGVEMAWSREERAVYVEID